VACRVLKVSRAGHYDWRGRAASARQVADDQLVETITRGHHDSRGTYGSPRVQPELRLGLGLVCGRERVARLMWAAGLRGIGHQHKHRHWKPDSVTHDDLVKRQFSAKAPDRVWWTDITQHRATDGWVYCCAVIDAYSRRIVGWSHPGRVRSEAEFASLAGTCPILASSERPLGIPSTAAATDGSLYDRVGAHATRPGNRAYVALGKPEGHTTKEIRRALKRYITP
jgi:transposase InsO family protein